MIAARPVGPAARLLDAARCASGWEQLPLAPLERDDALSLVAGVADPAVRERVVREGRGNPLFLRELARVADRGDGALPPTLVAAIGFEVAALEHAPARADRGRGRRRRPVRPGARGGDRRPRRRGRARGPGRAGRRRPRPSGPGGAEARPCVPTSAAYSDEVRSRVVAEWTMSACGAPLHPDLVPPAAAGRAFVFRHPLVRRAVYDACAPGWRLGAHERAAAALERRGAGPAARAYHVVRSAQHGDGDAVAVLCAAAEVAGQTSPAAAAHWYGAALRLVPDRDRETRAGLLARLRAGARRLGPARGRPHGAARGARAGAAARADDRLRADRDPARDAHRCPPAAAGRARRRAALPARGARVRARRGRVPRGSRRRAARLGRARRAGGAGRRAAARRRRGAVRARRALARRPRGRRGGPGPRVEPASTRSTTPRSPPTPRSRSTSGSRSSCTSASPPRPRPARARWRSRAAPARASSS